MDANNDNNHTVFIPTSVIDALQHGSLESKIDAAEDLVIANRSSFLSDHANDDIDVNVIATFEDHVIVATDEGRLYRAEITGGQLGKIELMDVPTIGQQHFKDFIKSKAIENVTKFIDTGNLVIEDLLGFRRTLDYYHNVDK